MTEQMRAFLELIDAGSFSRAVECAQKIMADKTCDEKISNEIHHRVSWMHRVKRDYPYSREQMINRCSRYFNDFSSKLFEEWDASGFFQKRIIDGEERYLRSAVSNLCFRYPDIRALRQFAFTGKQALLDSYQVMSKQADKDAAKTFNWSFRFDLNITCPLKKGDHLKVWLPFPLEFDHQSVTYDPARFPDSVTTQTHEDYPGTAYIERVFSSEDDRKFSLEYQTKTAYRLNYIQPAKVQPLPSDSRFGMDLKTIAQFGIYLKSDEMHISSSDALVEKTKQVIQNEQNPWNQAFLIYLWLGSAMKYSYAREYSTQTDIAETTFQRGYGDCGELTLLYISMCRIAGIPARWQSGWTFFPGWKHGIHDWCEIYLKPYGWVPVDPVVPVNFASEDCGADPAKIVQVLEFFFGNMDPFRLYLNRNHGLELNPEKQDIRSDDVDFQRGEVEVNGKNVFYDGFNYKMTVKEM